MRSSGKSIAQVVLISVLMRMIYFCKEIAKKHSFHYTMACERRRRYV